MKKKLALAVLPIILFNSTLPLRSQILSNKDYVPVGVLVRPNNGGSLRNLFKEVRWCDFPDRNSSALRNILKKIRDPKHLANLKEDPKLKKYKWVVQGQNFARFFKSEKKATKFLVKVRKVDDPDNLYKKGL